MTTATVNCVCGDPPHDQMCACGCADYQPDVDDTSCNCYICR